MQLHERLAHIEPHLVRLGRARHFESAARRIDDTLVRVHHGHYLPHQLWERLELPDRHLATLIAVQALAHTPPVFSHLSAAVLHGLPIYGATGQVVHETVATRRANERSLRVVRHRSDLAPHEVVEMQGFRCTSIERTLLDLCVGHSLETALVCADAHLREQFRVQRFIDEDRLSAWRTDMRRKVNGMRGRRGARAMRQLLELADPRTDSVLESISHLRLRQLGFEVELQVPVPGPNGGTYHVDFEFIGLNLFGECDGKVKYTDGAMLEGQTANEVVYREKRRQDWITAREQKRMIRWGYPEVRSLEVFERTLRAYNVPLPGRVLL